MGKEPKQHLPKSRGKTVQDALAQEDCLIGPPSAKELKSNRWLLAVNVPAQTENLAAQIPAVERVPSTNQGKPAQFIPIRFVCFNKLTKNDRLLLTFDAIVLSKATGRDVNLGKIIHGDDHATLKVKIPSLLVETRKLIGNTTALLAGDSPPDLILNRHCVECEFRNRCRQKTVEKDDLSLLGGMTEKERKRLQKKGVFTLTQLSYTFRPRRPGKRIAPRKEKYHPALRALAIREQKIHIVGNLELKIEGTPVYLDVEGIPDRDFYYLIGTNIETANGSVQRSFWADRIEDEKTIWADFLCLLAEVQNPILVHYGRFEAVFLKRMRERYGGPPAHLTPLVKAIEQPFNILLFIFAQIYFPTCSNGLKDIGAFVGAKWQSAEASGVQSLVWRYQWDETRSDYLKQTLLGYNQDDCRALRLLTEELKQIGKTASSRPDVEFAYAPKQNATEQGTAIHGNFEAILASAYSSYERSRIHIQKKQEGQPEASPSPKRISPIRARNFSAKQGRLVRVPFKQKCRIHRRQTLQPSDQMSQHTIVDLAFSKNGCKKTLTTYVGKLAHCPSCGLAHLPPTIQRLHQQVFGHGILSWIAYQRVTLRLPLGVISRTMFDVFFVDLNTSTISSLISRVADAHAQTEILLWHQILRSPVLHVDETKINIRGSIQYVWVFTDGKHVAFRLTITRETDFLQELLADYKGTLASDFYGGYDALPCRQQKCLVHLIRDLNNDLWKNPFNTEYERFVASVRDLLLPIFEDVEKFGLKACHLRKHKKAVEQFYQRTINVSTAKCEITATYQKRFIRYEQSLFTFLDSDGIPWHNNVAECAIRHFAVQRKISGFFYTKGAKEYLRLLGIAQTCRFQDKSFLSFLLSGCIDVDQFKGKKRRKPQGYSAALTNDDV